MQFFSVLWRAWFAGLLCLSNADEGGLSSWSSSMAVHNEILKQRPDLADTLTAPIWFFDRKGEVPEGKLPYFELPVFNYYQVNCAIQVPAFPGLDIAAAEGLHTFFLTFLRIQSQLNRDRRQWGKANVFHLWWWCFCCGLAPIDGFLCGISYLKVVCLT